MFLKPGKTFCTLAGFNRKSEIAAAIFFYGIKKVFHVNGTLIEAAVRVAASIIVMKVKMPYIR